MRALAAELGIQAMSLYSHVADKHDVLVGMVDYALQGVARQDSAVGDAWGDALSLATTLRLALLQYPNTTRLFAMNMTLQESPAVQEVTRRSFETLGRLDLDFSSAVYAYGTMLSFVIGHVLVEIAQAANGSVPVSLYDPARSFQLGIIALLGAFTNHS